MEAGYAVDGDAAGHINLILWNQYDGVHSIPPDLAGLNRRLENFSTKRIAHRP